MLVGSFSQRETDLIGYDPAGAGQLNIHAVYETRYYHTADLIFLGFNCQAGPMTSRELRRAVRAAVDIDYICSDILGSSVQPSPLVMNPALDIYDSSWEEGSGYSRDAFSAACAEKGIEVVAEESVATMTEVDYTNQFNQMVSAGAELVFTPFYYDVMGPYLIPQARSVGFDGVLLGADGVDNTETTIPDGADLSAYNNVMFVNHYSTELATSDVSLSFIESYEAKYGESPNNFDALAYDAVYVLVSAMEDAGAADAASVQASLADTSKVYEVSTGTFSFDDTGTPIKSGVLMGYQYDEATDSVQKISIETLSVD